jgi:hypothetical protein
MTTYDSRYCIVPFSFNIMGSLLLISALEASSLCSKPICATPRDVECLFGLWLSSCTRSSSCRIRSEGVLAGYVHRSVLRRLQFEHGSSLSQRTLRLAHGRQASMCGSAKSRGSGCTPLSQFQGALPRWHNSGPRPNPRSEARIPNTRLPIRSYMWVYT